ncbi:MAG: TerC/Alx family metal homeostasis membrane protein [Succinivibrio sp.]|nr:TerC/Alx family metal homeostasis membrane protein [Succinivibrio sp.]
MSPEQNLHIGLETETVCIFVVLAIFAFALDMWGHRADRVISLKTATLWTLFWVAVGLGFSLYLTVHFNSQVASLYLAGYLFEQALSVDNLFVMMAIFAWFKVDNHYVHRVLYWGVLGAVVFRLLFVLVGASLFALGPAVELIFAVVVGLSGVMMLTKKDEDKSKDFNQHFAYKAVRYFIPVFPKFVGHNFFISLATVQEELAKPENAGIILKRTGKWFCTPLFLCLVIIETTDVMFAFDSVPAVIAVSREPLIVYSAMMFAVMGLRSMYFVLDALRTYLVHLEKSVTILLFFIAIKLAAGASLHLWGVGFDLDVYVSLMVIAVILGLGILASVVFPKKA